MKVAAFLAIAVASAAVAAVVVAAPRPAPPPHNVLPPAAREPLDIARAIPCPQDPRDWFFVSAALDRPGKIVYLVSRSYTVMLDAGTGRELARIPDSWGNGVALVPEVGRGFISTGQWGLMVFDLKTHRELGRIRNEVVSIHGLGAMIYDPAAKRLLAVAAGSDTLVPIDPAIDLKSGKPDAEIHFGGIIRGMVADERGMVYVTVARSDSGPEHVAVLDTRHMAIATTWPIPPGAGNASGVSMDRRRSRLFIACNGQLLILSATDGHEINRLPVGTVPGGYAGSGTTAFSDGIALASCGDGTLAAIGQNSVGTFLVLQTFPTISGVSDIAVDPASGAFYVPIPDSADKIPPAGFKILVLQRPK